MPSYSTYTKQGKKKHRVVFDLPSSDGSRVQKKLSDFDTKRDASLAYIAFMSDYTEHIVNTTGDTFSEVFMRYLVYQETRLRESSFIDINNNYRLHLEQFFGSMKLDEIKPKDIINWQCMINKKECKGKLLSYQYKSKILNYLKTFFNYCIDIEEILKTNPAKKQLKFVNNKVKEEMLIYSPEEYLAFKNVIDIEQDSILFDVLYFTGCRKGELIALQWQDLKDGSLSVTKTYSRKTKNGGWILTPPKSNNGIRDILLPQFLINRLMELKVSKDSNDTDFIFGDEFPTNERHLDIARDKYYKRAKTKRIRIHDFRHSHVSYLISENIDIMTIAKRLGDKVETILSTYAHLMPSKQHELIAKLDSMANTVAINTNHQQVTKLVTLVT